MINTFKKVCKNFYLHIYYLFFLKIEKITNKIFNVYQIFRYLKKTNKPKKYQHILLGKL